MNFFKKAIKVAEQITGCAAGNHDWYYKVEPKFCCNIRSKYWAWRHGDSITLPDSSDDYKKVHQRVCLRCGELDDTYTPYLKNCEAELREKLDKIDLANKLIAEAKKKT